MILENHDIAQKNHFRQNVIAHKEVGVNPESIEIIKVPAASNIYQASGRDNIKKPL